MAALLNEQTASLLLMAVRQAEAYTSTRPAEGRVHYEATSVSGRDDRCSIPGLSVAGQGRTARSEAASWSCISEAWLHPSSSSRVLPLVIDHEGDLQRHKAFVQKGLPGPNSAGRSLHG